MEDINQRRRDFPGRRFFMSRGRGFPERGRASTMSDIFPHAEPEEAPPDRAAALQITIGIVDLQLRIMKSELIEIQIRLAEGDQAAIREGARLLSDIRYWLKQAHDVETEIETYRKANEGIAHDYAIDFDAARSQVRCRLDRLRDCRGPTVVS
jgi:hypothetical protein